MGFRPNRSTVDNIFMDFSYAFDTVNRDVIYNSLIKYNVPDKLIKLLKLTM
jgi:hypothetical protein